MTGTKFKVIVIVSHRGDVPMPLVYIACCMEMAVCGADLFLEGDMICPVTACTTTATTKHVMQHFV